MLAVGACTMLLIAVAALSRELNKTRKLASARLTEISRVQMIAMRERLALGDHIQFRGGSYQDAPNYTAQELAVHVRREYEEVLMDGRPIETAWLTATMFCLALVSAETRVYFDEEARERARVAKERVTALENT